MAAMQGRRRNLQLMTALGVLAGGLYGYTLTVISGALVGMTHRYNYDMYVHGLENGNR